MKYVHVEEQCDLDCNRKPKCNHLLNGGLYTVTNAYDDYRFDRMTVDCSSFNCPSGDSYDIWNAIQNQFDYDSQQTFTGSVKSANYPHVERNQIWEFRRAADQSGNLTTNQWYIHTMIEEAQNQNWRLAKEMNRERICYVAEAKDIYATEDDPNDPNARRVIEYQQWQLEKVETDSDPNTCEKPSKCSDVYTIMNVANNEFLAKFNDKIDLGLFEHVNFGTGSSSQDAAQWRITSIFKDPAFYWEHFFKYENKADVTVTVTVEVVYGVTTSGLIQLTTNQQPSIEAGLRHVFKLIILAPLLIGPLKRCFNWPKVLNSKHQFENPSKCKSRPVR